MMLHRRSSVRGRAARTAAVAGVFTLVTLAFGGDPAFTDATEAVGIDIVQTPASALFLAPFNVTNMPGGGAVGDFDRDGFQDVYIAGVGGVHDRLYMNNGDGTFTDRAAEAGLGERIMSIGAAVGDYDNDGWLDIFVISYGPAKTNQPPAGGHHRLWRNNGDGTFTDRAVEAGVNDSHGGPDGWGPAFGDYDLDGDLDLFVPHWLGSGNTLFRNEGDGTFTDVTIPAGVHEPGVRGFSARFADMNGDRWPELLVAADFDTSRYYVNNRDGTFTEYTAESNTGWDGNGMGHAIGDVDGDGRPEWYVTSIHSVADGTPGIPGTGNMLYLNLGAHLFEESGTVYGLTDGGWGWGTEFVDIEHDGLEDIIETNGWREINSEGWLEWINEPCYVFRRQGLTFVDVAAQCGFVNSYQGRGLVRLDLENDGDQDVIVFANQDPTRFMRNELVPADDTHWLRLFFDTSANPRLAPDGYGTRVVARRGRTQTAHWMTGGSTYTAQSELSVHIGLHTATTVDELRIEWADGTVTVLSDVPADRTLTIESGFRSDLDGDGVVGITDLLGLLAAWGRAGPAADLDADGVVGATDLAVLVENWTR